MAFEDIPNAADRFAMYALSRLLRRSTPSRLPSKPDKQPTADVALDEGGVLSIEASWPANHRTAVTSR